MGSLSTFGLLENEKSEKSFKEAVELAIRNGQGPDIFGIPNPVSVPKIKDPTTLEEQIKILDGQHFSKVHVDSYIKMLEFIDVIPEGNAAAAFGIVDPTTPLRSLIDELLEVIGELVDVNALDWFIENIPKIIEKAGSFPLALLKLQQGAAGSLAEILNEIDSSIDVDLAKEKIEASPISGKALESEPDDTSSESFSPNYGSVIVEPNSLQLPKIPHGFDMPIPGSEFLNINWAILSIFQSFTNALKSIMNTITEIVYLLLDGLEAFLKGIIEKILELVANSVNSNLGSMMNSVVFSAVVATLLSLLTGAIVVSVLGFLIGSGMMNYGAANLLGLFG